LKHEWRDNAQIKGLTGLKILYTSDLHGHRSSYEKVYERASELGVSAVVNGGDVYPLGADLFAVQREFLEGYFPDYLERLHREGIAYLATLGNMDLRGHDDLFRNVMAQVPETHCLLEASAVFGEYTFIGSAISTDGPFSLKDRCLRDTADSDLSGSLNRALVSDHRGIHEIDDWPDRLHKLPTLAEHLAALPRPEDPEKTVYVLHQPPSGVGQGIISSGTDVGSQSVADFLARSGALLSLHGHIHESPFVGGNWRSRIGRTVCVQPGQLPGRNPVTVLIELENLEMERHY